MSKLQNLLKSIGDEADGILITSEHNQLYLTNFSYSDGYALITKNRSYLITDFRYVEAAKNEADKSFEIISLSGSRNNTLQTLFKENNVKKLMFEDTVVSYNQYSSFKNSFPDIELIPAGNIIENLRETKTDIEAEYVTKAQRIAEKSLEMLLNNFDKNVTEREIASYLEYLMKKNGSEDISFKTIAVSGKASSLPHGVPRDKKLENGFLTIDFGAVYKGYRSDMTRTFCIGKADDEMKKVYSTVLNAQNNAIDAIMNGERNCRTIDKIARDIIYNNGYKNCFGHGLGHGVGIEIHENPRLSPNVNSDCMLKFGNIVTVEPGIYIENKYGVRIEDIIYISNSAPINLTKMPKNLIEL